MTDLFICPKGHNSTEPDYCSECGVKIAGTGTFAAQPLQTSALTSSSSQICPDCSAPHDPVGGNFCEICGYNFITGQHGELAIPNPPPSTPTIVQASQSEIGLSPVPASSTSISTTLPESQHETSLPKEQPLIIWWELVAIVDPCLRHPESPEPPINQPPLRISLKPGTNLIGRSSPARAIYPDIALDFDNAVSHRHAVLNCQSDGTLILRDIGSSNGTQFRGEELKPMVDVNLQDGDEFTLGHWTRITIKAL